jgi:hypothetical protein
MWMPAKEKAGASCRSPPANGDLKAMSQIRNPDYPRKHCAVHCQSSDEVAAQRWADYTRRLAAAMETGSICDRKSAEAAWRSFCSCFLPGDAARCIPTPVLLKQRAEVRA